MENQETLTKWFFYKRSLKIALIVATVSIGVIFVTTLFPGDDFILTLEFAFGWFIIVFGLLILLQTDVTNGTIERLKDQEKLLGIQFEEEMKRLNLTVANHKSIEWFIGFTRMGYCYILHRSYIKEIVKSKRFKTRAGLEVASATVLTMNGRKIKMDNSVLVVDFLNWYEQNQSNSIE